MSGAGPASTASRVRRTLVSVRPIRLFGDPVLRTPVVYPAGVSGRLTLSFRPLDPAVVVDNPRPSITFRLLPRRIVAFPLHTATSAPSIVTVGFAS